MQRLLLMALAGSSLVLFAGAPPWTTLPLTAVAVAAACARPFRTFAFPASDRVVDLALAAACGAIALQLLPLPVGLRDAISPNAAHVVDALRLDRRYTEAAWAPLSVDPAATWHALGTTAMATLALWTTRAVLAVSSVRWLVRAMVIGGGVLATTSLVFRAIDPLRIYAAWEPSTAAARPFGPFVNRNHLAGWMLIVIPIGVGYLLAHLRTHLRQDVLRWRELAQALTRTWAAPVAISVMLMSAAVLATLSRSAFAGLGVAAIVTWRIGHHRLAGSGMMRRLVVVAAAGAVMLLAAIDISAIAARVASTVADRPVDRLVIWGETLRVIAQFPVAGVGAGAFGAGMLVSQQTQLRMPHQQDWVHFNQAHSHYLQVPAEGGMVLATVAAAGLIGLLLAARRMLLADVSAISLVRVGAAAGLTGIATQSIWETSLTMPANAVIAAIAAGLLLHAPRLDAHPHQASRALVDDGRERPSQFRVQENVARRDGGVRGRNRRVDGARSTGQASAPAD